MKNGKAVSVPYRGATFLNYDMLGIYRTKIGVSVPYRGATFLNNLSYYIPGYGTVYVSVPYRGATFLNSHIIIGWCAYQFPSPIGELHFSIWMLSIRL